MEEVLHEVAERPQDNYPSFHPLYAGQMLKPPHPVAHLAYALAMWINPNNHALDGGRASEASGMARQIFAEAARQNLHLALAELPADFFDLPAAGMERDRDRVTRNMNRCGSG